MPSAGKCISTISGTVFRIIGRKIRSLALPEIDVLLRRNADDRRQIGRASGAS